MLNFYQINGDGKIRTRDRLVIKALIPYQRTISTQKLKLLGKVSGYDLYYSLTVGVADNLSLYTACFYGAMVITWEGLWFHVYRGMDFDSIEFQGGIQFMA